VKVVLSEGFTYDALDRLTQSSTTGKIDDVDYSYKVDYQYDIVVFVVEAFTPAFG
jgi:hypothetical protein